MAQFRKDTHQYLADGKTIYEVVMLADQYGNLVGPANPSGMSVDGFGRARSSQPFTLFDSFHRYKDNGKVNAANSAGGTYQFNANTSSIDCTVTTTSGAYVYRETKKVFAYQPGKSLQIMATFVMNPAKTNLRQRIGYFGTENGFYLERSAATTSGVSFVKRTKVSGVVQDIPVDQADWNIDKLDGTGPSLLTLNLDNPQILFMDIEWLGVGSVRMGFVINGELIHCHSFHHSNLTSSPKGAYMQTACLPLRLEIENTGTTASNSTYIQVCSTVISEGGYTLAGKPRVAASNLTSGVELVTPGTYYPVVSIRLNPDYPDAIVIPKQIDMLPLKAAEYQYKIIKGATINGAVWANVATDSVVQYNSNSTATISGGEELNTGYVTSTVQGGGSLNFSSGEIFQYQLERNTFANTTTTLTLAATCRTATSNVAAAIMFEEIT